jgi:hypothetical protein
VVFCLDAPHPAGRGGSTLLGDEYPHGLRTPALRCFPPAFLKGFAQLGSRDDHYLRCRACWSAGAGTGARRGRSQAGRSSRASHRRAPRYAKVLEETGLRVRATGVIGSWVYPRTGVVIAYVAAVSLADTKVGAAAEELSEVRWVDLAEAQELMRTSPNRYAGT